MKNDGCIGCEHFVIHGGCHGFCGYETPLEKRDPVTGKHLMKRYDSYEILNANLDCEFYVKRAYTRELLAAAVIALVVIVWVTAFIVYR